jgi:hypothetical protein
MTAKWKTEETKRMRRIILGKLGSKCVRCGFSDPRALQIDHVNGGGRFERRTLKGSTLRYYRYILGRISSGEYQLLRANCNSIKREEMHEFKAPIQTCKDFCPLTAVRTFFRHLDREYAPAIPLAEKTQQIESSRFHRRYTRITPEVYQRVISFRARGFSYCEVRRRLAADTAAPVTLSAAGIFYAVRRAQQA